MDKIGVVVCNYNKANDLDKCITSILESTYKAIDIYVVDNASKDNSLELLHSKYEDKVFIIENSENLGGSGGFNKGLRTALKKDYKYLMCVDNDAMLDEKAVENLKAFLDRHNESGMACAKVYNTTAPNIVQQYGIEVDFEDYCVKSPFAGRLEDGTMPEYVYCDAVPACALMLRREVIDKIGVMPEENFLYWDDTTWCKRATAAGYKIACLGDAKALHAMGAKKEIVNTFPTYYAWRNWIKFFMEFTKEDEIDRMCEVFLRNVFVAVYDSEYNEETCRLSTIMAAFNDAIYGNYGKASEGIIGEVKNLYKREKEIVKRYNMINIKSNNLLEEAKNLKQRLERLAIKMNENIIVRIDGLSKPDIVMCDYIFTLDDLSLEYIYADKNENILLTEEDTYFVMNFAYSKKVFHDMYKDLFLRQVKKIRNKETKK
ncbi:glycosyltransferase family 2 protein [Lachnobacterium bovis]|uniref:glycosyltransferase family 2 protein n=1 Tax=Lachnobacterium bovis TaxID=140626 RepID=UPI00048671B1|nr:glycosyltransferase family 2 protein [Lachnobacterium bovis]